MVLGLETREMRYWNKQWLHNRNVRNSHGKFRIHVSFVDSSREIDTDLGNKGAKSGSLSYAAEQMKWEETNELVIKICAT